MALLTQQLIKRFVGVQEIGAMTVCLADDRALFLSGAAIVIDGGWTVHRDGEPHSYRMAHSRFESSWPVTASEGSGGGRVFRARLTGFSGPAAHEACARLRTIGTNGFVLPPGSGA